MQQRNGMATRSPRNLWLYFPWFIVAAMGAVVAVNFFMAYSALHTFPGSAGSDGFDLSNHYDAIIERVRQEAGLGWAIQANVDESGHPVIVVTDRTATPLAACGDRGHCGNGRSATGTCGRCGSRNSRQAIIVATSPWTRRASGNWKSGSPPVVRNSARRGGSCCGDHACARRRCGRGGGRLLHTLRTTGSGRLGGFVAQDVKLRLMRFRRWVLDLSTNVALPSGRRGRNDLNPCDLTRFITTRSGWRQGACAGDRWVALRSLRLADRIRAGN